MISNELPRFGDASGAIANRFVVLTLTESFLGRENPALTEELLTELPSIFSWSLDGLERLNRHNRFTEPQSSIDAVVALMDLVSPVAAFVRDQCIRGPYEVAVDDLWAAWRAWSEENGHHHGSKQSFGRDLRAVIPGLRMVRPRGGRAEPADTRGSPLLRPTMARTADRRGPPGRKGDQRTLMGSLVRSGPRPNPM